MARMPWSVPTTAALLFTLGSIAQLPCGTPSGPSLRSGIASDGGFSVQRAFVDHVGEARILPHSGLEGALRLRGGVSGKHRTKKTKDPAEMGVVPLADSMTNGWCAPTCYLHTLDGDCVSEAWTRITPS